MISDGGPGLIGALDAVFPAAARQRCLVHRARNTLAKVAKADAEAVRAAYWKIFDDVGGQPGPAAQALARGHAADFAAAWEGRYPGAVTCVTSDFEHLIAYLAFPVGHHKRIRHSNLIERTFGETRRRVKVIGRLPGEASCLGLVWAVLDRATAGWRGVEVTPADARLLQRLRAAQQPTILPGPGAPAPAPARDIAA